MAGGLAKGSVWSSQAVIFISILVFGLIVGIIISHYYVEPLLSGKIISTSEPCYAKTTMLETQLDDCYKCLDDKNIQISSCGN